MTGGDQLENGGIASFLKGAHGRILALCAAILMVAATFHDAAHFDFDHADQRNALNDHLDHITNFAPRLARNNHTDHHGHHDHGHDDDHDEHESHDQLPAGDEDHEKHEDCAAFHFVANKSADAPISVATILAPSSRYGDRLSFDSQAPKRTIAFHHQFARGPPTILSKA